MPRDMSRVTYDANGGMVTKIPEGTPKEEIKKARAEGRVDKNDPAYNVDDAKADADRQEEAAKDQAPLVANQAAVQNAVTSGNDSNKPSDAPGQNG